MALAIADFMADGEVFCVAVATVAQGLNMLERRRFWRDMLAANPAWHHAVKLARHYFVYLDPMVSQTAHGDIFTQKRRAAARAISFCFGPASLIHTLSTTDFPAWTLKLAKVSIAVTGRRTSSTTRKVVLRCRGVNSTTP